MVFSRPKMTRDSIVSWVNVFYFRVPEAVIVSWVNVFYSRVMFRLVAHVCLTSAEVISEP